jgi:hypothetical protein
MNVIEIVRDERPEVSPLDPVHRDAVRRRLTGSADSPRLTTRRSQIEAAPSVPASPRRPPRWLAAVAAVLVAAALGAIVIVDGRRTPVTSQAPTGSNVPVEPSPQAVRDIVNNIGSASDPVECDVLTAEVERVATATDPYGGPDYEWWVAPTSGGGRSETVVQLDADGQVIGGGGGSLHCNPTAGDIYSGGGGGNGGPSPMVSHVGQVSVGATAVVLTFPGPVTVEVPVNANGYFLTILAEDPNGPFSYPERVDAIDGTGAVVATRDYRRRASTTETTPPMTSTGLGSGGLSMVPEGNGASASADNGPDGLGFISVAQLNQAASENGFKDASPDPMMAFIADCLVRNGYDVTLHASGFSSRAPDEEVVSCNGELRALTVP